MRILGVGTTCDLASLYGRLAAAGHEVRVAIAEPMCHDVGAGMFGRVDDWRAALPWVGRDGLILFEDALSGAHQDALRRDGYRVVGGSAWGDRLEKDRAFGQALLGAHGLQTAETHGFTDAAKGEAFVAANPRRWALKFDVPDFGAAGTYVGRLHDGRDTRAMLRARARQAGGAPLRFILMAVVEGVEVGIGCWFDGHRFVQPACLDWEHKRFFTGDVGELVAEMGTVATFEGSGRLFERTLAPLAAGLAAAGHVGWVNLNTICNTDGIWPLEFTCRFGYPGYAVLEPLHAAGWGTLLPAIADGTLDRLPVTSGYSVGVVITTRPFPYIRHHVDEPVGLPIVFDGDVDPAHVHYGEVGLNHDGEPVTAGYHGWTMIVTGTGASVRAAQAAAYARVARVVVPGMRYRTDIGDCLVMTGLADLERFGLLSPQD